MSISTEPADGIPRPPALRKALDEHTHGRLSDAELTRLQDSRADTLAGLEKLGCEVLTDGEQATPEASAYPVAGPDGITIPYADGHTRQLPRLTSGPFR